MDLSKYSTELLVNTIIGFNNKETKKDKEDWINDEIIPEFSKREDKDKFHGVILDTLIEEGIKNEHILHFYIKEFLGFDIPRHKACLKHVAPFSFVADMFFEKVRNSIAFANRTGGKTLNIAILNHLDMTFKKGCEIATAGSTLDQAARGYRYFRDFHNKDEYLSELLLKDPTMKQSFYNNGSMLEIITGTVAGLNSPHPQKARIDEIELMEWNVLQEGLSMTMTDKSIVTGKKIMSQFAFSSTRKYESGTMQRLLDMAGEDKRKFGGFKVYNWCVWEILEKCTRKCIGDKKYGNCPIIDICKEKARKCKGFYDIDDFIDKVVLLDNDTLEAQWFNMRPSRQQFVYGEYWNRKTHYIPKIEFDMNDDGIIVIGGIDFGSSPGHPFVYKEYICDCKEFKREVENLDYSEDEVRAKVKFYLNYEYRSGAATMEDHSLKIKESPNYHEEMIIFADPSAKQERIDLELIYGIATLQADNAVTAGIDRVRAHLQIRNKNSYYYIMEDYFDCDSLEIIGSDKEIELYKFKRGRDGKILPKEPEKTNDHGMDIDRYVISSATVYLKEYYLPVFEDIEEEEWW